MVPAEGTLDARPRSDSDTFGQARGRCLWLAAGMSTIAKSTCLLWEISRSVPKTGQGWVYGGDPDGPTLRGLLPAATRYLFNVAEISRPFGCFGQPVQKGTTRSPRSIFLWAAFCAARRPAVELPAHSLQ